MPLTARRWKSADGETLGSLSALVLQTYAGNPEHGVKEEGRKDRIRKQGEQKAERSHLCVLPSQAGVLLGGRGPLVPSGPSGFVLIFTYKTRLPLQPLQGCCDN